MQTNHIDENNLAQDRKYLLDESLISIIQYFSLVSMETALVQ